MTLMTNSTLKTKKHLIDNAILHCDFQQFKAYIEKE